MAEQRATTAPVVVSCGNEDHDVDVRPGVIVWLDKDDPSPDEVARAMAMRRHPSSGRARHLRVVS